MHGRRRDRLPGTGAGAARGARPCPRAQAAADAGHADGFEVTLDCPNDRYVNDQAICIAVAAMLGRVGVKVRVDARPKTIFFKMIERVDTSFYLLGWGGSTTDAQGQLDPIVSRRNVTPVVMPDNAARAHWVRFD